LTILRHREFFNDRANVVIPEISDIGRRSGGMRIVFLASLDAISVMKFTSNINPRRLN